MKPPPRPQDETPAEATQARLRLYNTLTRRKEDFAPIDPNAVRLYVCGPTVYDFAHIGNARPVIVFDVLFRLLRHLYGADHVIYARNITDVDDKINARAARDFPDLPLNEAIAKVTEATERQFHEDVAALGALPPTARTARHPIYRQDARDDRAPDRARRRLCRRGSCAVLAGRDGRAARGAALRDARASLARRDAGRRARRCRALQARPDGLRPVEAVEAERAGLAEPGRHRGAGASRLAYRVLGDVDGDAARAVRRRPRMRRPEPQHFDIHGGGIDLVFPHHENEIAQSCCAFGSAAHGQCLDAQRLPAGRRREDVEEPRQFRHHPRTACARPSSAAGNGRARCLRLAMLRTHYRQPIDWTVKALEEAEATLDRWYDAVGDVEATSGDPRRGRSGRPGGRPQYAGAIAELHRLAHRGAETAILSSGRAERSHRDLKTSANLLGLLRANAIRAQAIGAAARRRSTPPRSTLIVAERAQARAAQELGRVRPAARPVWPRSASRSRTTRMARRPGSSSDERRLASPLSARRRATLRRDLSREHRGAGGRRL